MVKRCGVDRHLSVKTVRVLPNTRSEWTRFGFVLCATLASGMTFKDWSAAGTPFPPGYYALQATAATAVMLGAHLLRRTHPGLSLIGWAVGLTALLTAFSVPAD